MRSKAYASMGEAETLRLVNVRATLNEDNPVAGTRKGWWGWRRKPNGTRIETVAKQLVILERSEQIRLLINGRKSSKFSSIRLRFFGSIPTKNGLIVQAELFGERVLLGSEYHLRKPITFCYLVDSNVLVFDSPTDPQSFLINTFSSASIKNKLFSQGWNRPKTKIGFFINDGRPAHVVGEELSGYFYASEMAGNWLPLHVRDRSAFMELSLLQSAGVPLEVGNPRMKFHSVAYFRSLQPWQPHSDFGDFWGWLRAISKQGAFDAPVGWPSEVPIVYLGVTSGETRCWVEETETLVKIIAHSREFYSQQVKFVFDGAVGSLLNTVEQEKLCELQSRAVEECVKGAGLHSGEWLSIVGSGVLEKVFWASRSEFFVSGGYTPPIWPSRIAMAWGVRHAPPTQEYSSSQPKKVVFGSRVFSPQLEDINPVDGRQLLDQGALLRLREGESWQSYSIKPEVILELVEQMLSAKEADTRSRANSFHEDQIM